MSDSKKAPGMLDFCTEVISSTENCIKFMREYGLLKRDMKCECGEAMKILRRNDISDKEVWSCRCLKRNSIRKGSFFEKSKLPLINLMQIVYAFGLDFQVYQCQKLMPQTDEKTIIDWYSMLRDACSSGLIQNPVTLGTGHATDVIEVDESLFGKKRKYHKGTGNQKFWVFGMVERGTRNSVMQFVDKRDKNSLIPIIQKYVKEGSTIYSDQWGAYNSLSSQGYNHSTVNHSVEFKSADGCCTNYVEGLWGLAKLRIKKMKGILPDKLPAILDEFMYRYRFGHENGDTFYRIVYDVANVVPSK